MAAAGYAVFALHPERLAGVPSAAAVYGQALRVFPPAHIVAGVVVLGVILTRRVRTAWVPAAAVLYALSLASELLGTTVGLPFGPYRYGDGLGIKWFAHVPVLVPASWFMMALPSFALATRWVTTHRVWRTRRRDWAARELGPRARPGDEPPHAVLGVGERRPVLRDAARSTSSAGTSPGSSLMAALALFERRSLALRACRRRRCSASTPPTSRFRS